MPCLAGKRIGQGRRGQRMEEEAKDRPGPGWRGWVLAILVAAILSVTVTLLLGRDFSFGTGRSTAGGYGPGAACCPGAANGARRGK